MRGGFFAKHRKSAKNRVLLRSTFLNGEITPWAPNVDANVFAIAAGGGMVYAGGDFSQINSQPRNRLAAIDAATGILVAWNPGVNSDYSYVYAIAVNSGIVYVGGEFTAVGNDPQPYFAQFGGFQKCIDFNGDGIADVAAFHLFSDQFFTDYGGNLGQYGWGGSDSIP